MERQLLSSLQQRFQRKAIYDDSVTTPVLGALYSPRCPFHLIQKLNLDAARVLRRPDDYRILDGDGFRGAVAGTHSEIQATLMLKKQKDFRTVRDVLQQVCIHHSFFPLELTDWRI